MVKINNDKTAMYLIAIVGVVAAVGIVVLMSGGLGSSVDVSGQAVKVSATKAASSSLKLDTDGDLFPDWYESMTGTDKSDASSYDSCYDTDDPEDLSKKGVLYWVTSGGTFTSSEDFCVTDSIVDTYYCTSSDGVSTQTYDCPSGETCSDGSCIAETATSKKLASSVTTSPVTSVKCKDNDASYYKDQQYYKMKSTTTKGGITVTDSCTDTDSVYEGSCSENELTQASVSCSGLFGAEYTCSNGACVRGS